MAEQLENGSPSMDEILADTPPDVLDQPCQDEHLLEIAGHITDLPAVSPHMGLTKAEEEEIVNKYPQSLVRQKSEVLRKWKDKEGKQGTYRQLCTRFDKANKIEVVKYVAVVLSTQENGFDEADNAPPPKKANISRSVHANASQGDPLQRYTDRLRTSYGTRRPDFLVLQWPPPPTREVFNLTMIRSKEVVRRQMPNEQSVRDIHSGSVEQIVQGLTKATMENLFLLDNEERKVILVEGAPGSGKSTLAWYICRIWKEGTSYQEFMIVIYISLRDPKIQSAKSLLDLLPTYSTINRKDVECKLESCLGDEVLFVLDGWDEYEPGLQNTDSPVRQLICEPDELNLPKSAVVITSRPIASRELQKYASTRVEIVGFTPSEVSRYFQEALGDSEAVKALQDQLSKRPSVQASCSIPLNAAIVAHVFMERNHTLPTTLHGVFSAVVCGCIRRYLKKKTGKEREVASLTVLPTCVEDKFKKLCIVAYEGSKRNKVTFTDQDFHLHDLSSDVNVLDLVQVVKSFASSNSTLCHFLHLSVQELLTARHAAFEMPASQQVQFFKEMFNVPRFAAIFRFYAAFTKLATEGIRDILKQITHSEDKQQQLNLIHCLYEAQDESLCHFVVNQLDRTYDLSHTNLTASDCLSLGYFVSCISLPSGIFKLDLSVCSLDAYKLDFFVKGLISGDHVSSMLELDLGRNKLTSNGGFSSIVQVLKNMSVLKLSLRNCCLKDLEGHDLLGNALKDNATLQELDFGGNQTLCDGTVGCIAEGLSKNNTLKVLSLESCSYLSKRRSENKTELLVPLDNKSGQQLTRLLGQNGTLRELNLSRNFISANGLCCIVEGLKYNSGVDVLSLQRCLLNVTETNAPLLAEMLTVNKTLKELDLRGSSIGAIGLGSIAEGLKCNTGLEKLSLRHCALEVTASNRPVLLEMLKHNKTLRELDIGENQLIGGIGLRCIGEGLMHNTSLTTLSLQSCSKVVVDMLGTDNAEEHLEYRITDKDLLGLGEGLKFNSRLQVLNLKNSLEQVTVECRRQFVLCLRENTHLTTLVLGSWKPGAVGSEEREVNEERQKKGVCVLQIS